MYTFRVVVVVVVVSAVVVVERGGGPGRRRWVDEEVEDEEGVEGAGGGGMVGSMYESRVEWVSSLPGGARVRGSIRPTTPCVTTGRSGVPRASTVFASQCKADGTWGFGAHPSPAFHMPMHMPVIMIARRSKGFRGLGIVQFV